MTRRTLSRKLGLAISALTIGCTPISEAAKPPKGAILMPPGERPKGGRVGACYGKDTTPAVIDTITETKQVAPAKFSADGSTIITPPQFETTTRQVVRAGGQIYYFEVPCPPAYTPEFIASLQRALQVRGLYDGPINSTLDQATKAAIRAFQSPAFNSDILTLDTARKLGLVAFAPPPIYEGA